MARITRYTPTRITPLGSLESGFGSMWPVSRLHQEMNRLFSDVFGGFEEGGEEGRQGWMFNPVVEVEQRNDQYEISVELPGVRPEDVNVEVQEDMLTISGSKERKQTRGEGENRQSERVYGSFRRAFSLPEDAKEEEIRADFRDGVLTIAIPREARPQPSQARRIEVKQGEGEGEGPGQEPRQAGTEQKGGKASATH